MADDEGCCTACHGRGGALLDGPCWDCQGTGHAHAAEVGCQSPGQEIDRLLPRVLDEEGARLWWDVPIPRLNNATGRQMLAAGDGDKLLAYVKTYFDPMGS